MTLGDRPMVNDLSYRPWEVSAAAIAALRERLIKEGLPAALVRVELVGTSKVQLVENPTSQTQAEAPPRQVTAVEWITCEAQRLKRTDKIPVGIKMTPFAKMLATNMEKAARTDRSISISPVGWRHILNHLREWGLWPIDSIK